MNNLITLTDNRHKSVTIHNQTDVIYLDFKNALDLVNLDILLLKLKLSNIPDHVLNRIKDYPTKGKQSLC